MRTQDKVKLSQSHIVLPVQVVHEDMHPDLFQKMRRWTIAYPYPRNDRTEKRMRRRRLRTLVIENAALKLTVVPELGSHLFSAYDKLNDREVFHRLSDIRTRPLGRRGAWAPIGVEFNFPSSHSPSTFSPVDAMLRRNDDGSASIVLGDVERISHMRWSVDLTLRPGVNAVEATVTLHNRTNEPHGYYYWANAAIPADENTRFIIPMTHTRGHGLPGAGQDWPVRGGTDYSYHANIRHTMGVFANGCREDFFGAYDVHNDWGVVHVADYRVLPGKKMFTWGLGPGGLRKSTEYSPKGGCYAELQAGIFEHQPSYETMPPHATIRFSEVWLPVHGMKQPFSRATTDAAVALHRLEDRRFHVAVWVPRRRAGCRIRLTHHGDVLYRTTRDLSPEAPFVTTVALRGRRRIDFEKLELSVTSRDGDEMITHRPLRADPADGEAPGWLDGPAHADESSNHRRRSVADETVEQQHLRALRFDKMGLSFRARLLYEKVLERDEGYAPTCATLGYVYLRAGLFDKAVAHFERALARDAQCIEARYALGLAHAALGDDPSAKDAFWVALRAQAGDARCLMELGRIALRQQQYDEAVDFFSRASTISPDDARAVGMLSAALRRLGRPEDARAAVASAVARFPTSYLLRHETLLLARQRKRTSLAKRARSDLRELLRRNVEAWIDLGNDYLEAGLLDEALSVFRAGIAATRSGGQVYPMLHYYAGAVLEALGRTARARTEYRRGARMKGDRCFPGRTRAIAVLERVLACQPDDVNALFALGNILFHRTRRAEAAALWRRALKQDGDNRVLIANLALAAWEDDDPRRTAFYLGKAVRRDPNNTRLALWLHQVTAETLSDRDRLKQLQKTFDKHPDNDDVREQYASLFLDMGRPRRALELIAEHTFRTRHGIFSLSQLHVNAHTMLGERLFARRHYAAALEEFTQADHIPIRLGEDEQRHQFFGKAHYMAGQCLEKLDRPREARSRYRRCVSERRHWLPELFYYDCLSYRKLGKPKRAAEALERLNRSLEHMERVPNARPAYVHHLRSLHLSALGRKKEAQKEARRARRRGWRPSNELQFRFRFGFS